MNFERMNISPDFIRLSIKIYSSILLHLKKFIHPFIKANKKNE